LHQTDVEGCNLKCLLILELKTGTCSLAVHIGTSDVFGPSWEIDVTDML